MIIKEMRYKMNIRHEENKSTACRLIHLRWEVNQLDVTPEYASGLKKGIETVIGILKQQNKDFRETLEAMEKK